MRTVRFLFQGEYLERVKDHRVDNIKTTNLDSKSEAVMVI